jgi:replicative DNA helicase
MTDKEKSNNRGKKSSTKVDRVPPNAIDVEMAVLGAMMLEQGAAARVFEILDETCFFKDAHRDVFLAAQRLYQRNDPIDIVTVTEALNAANQLDDVGGAAYLAELTGVVASPANVEHHARIVLRKSLLRKMIHTCTRAIDQCYTEPDEVDALLDGTENELFKLMQFRKTGGFRRLGPMLVDTFESLENIAQMQGGVTGVPSTFDDLDKITSGWQNGDMIVIAGRPSMGKTAFSLNLARNAAVEHKIPIGFFSLEMADRQLALRLLCAESGVDSAKVRSGRLRSDEWPRLSEKVGKLAEAPLYIDDTPSLTPMELRARARRLKSEHNVGLIIIDYIGLMEIPQKRFESQQQKIAEISRNLKALAKDLEVPVIVLSQLSRAVETRHGDKRPILSDLRDSGAIEQDADVVIFLYRPGLYEEKTKDGNDVDESYTEIIIAKQRNGPMGTAKLHFNLQTGLFQSLDIAHHALEDGSMDTHPF